MKNILSSVLSDNFYEKKNIANENTNSYNSLDCAWLVDQLTKAALDVSVSRFREGCLKKNSIELNAVSLPEVLDEESFVQCHTVKRRKAVKKNSFEGINVNKLLQPLTLIEKRLYFYPHGFSVWRETTLGQCLLDTLEDLCSVEAFQLDTVNILKCFDSVMNQQILTTKVLGNWKIISGTIEKVKNRRRCYMSDFIRIVAAEIQTAS
ncbi:uncharacterized protein LOC128883248 isoform X2 [Hylaeus volcanicus]|uniref:uncharacterized protein LOC128883248 isoform X2 n=1 Tax=Hylaeus volcanicus TaxID=313075 RepID=UPI0023B77630|nr:uncharacterized protein LOC128883248 isoform X2 [Hylaeus volcanicus]